MPDFSQSKSPTVLSPPPRMARAAADLAEQIKKERYEHAQEIGRGGMGKILEAALAQPDDAIFRDVLVGAQPHGRRSFGNGEDLLFV